MTFSVGFLSALVIIALVWCAAAVAVLLGMLTKEWKGGRIW